MITGINAPAIIESWIGLMPLRSISVIHECRSIFFFVLLVGWVFLALMGYSLILWSPAFVHGMGTLTISKPLDAPEPAPCGAGSPA
jgi:hypothetical protein